MSDSGSTQPPGWYPAQGDPPGTQRYWDGTQWVGGPQAAQPGAVDQGGVAPGGYAQPAQYGAAPVGGGVGRPASYGSRVVAYLIDFAIAMAILIVLGIVAVILGLISETLGIIFLIIGIYIAPLVFSLWNSVFRQGSTGQTIGKEKQNIKLVADATGQPVGAGMAFVRLLLGGILVNFCLIDILWPLWDEEKKRLSDKILNFSVVDV